MINYVNKFFSRIVRLFYINRTLLVFQLANEAKLIESIRLNKIETEDGGFKLYLVDGDEDVHYSYFNTGVIYCKEVDANIVTDLMYMYRCYTSKEYRNKGLYREAISLATNMFPESDIYISVLASNEQSVRVIMKNTSKLCGIYYYRRYFFFFKKRSYFFNDSNIKIVESNK
ncbi:N-acetyltransferase [Shewanella algae]|uniref:N-acetyltransferase n=1 Tax=Shewanella algae TaxID=38313 RepID=UPI0005CDC7E2|nr:N-acetyltransferase [Shewanella algae]